MSLFLDAISKRPVSRPPVWIMRQAGRYLPEYRALREKSGGFMSMCQTPEIACEITLQPIRRYGFDAAIIFSDILTIPDAMGLGLRFEPGQGPIFDSPLKNANDIKRLSVPDPESSLGYVMDAIRVTKPELDVPLIGFSGSPWTLAAYMVQGRSVPGFPQLIALKEEQPQLLHILLDLLATSVTSYLEAQISAGVDTVMLFDTWGGLLDKPAYQAFSLSYLAKIVANLKNNPVTAQTPIILFTKGGGEWLEIMVDTGCDALGIDWTCSLARAKARVGGEVALQGNMNPETLKMDDDTIIKETLACLDVYRGESGYIFNLGHGITPDINPEKVHLLVDTVKSYGQ